MSLLRVLLLSLCLAGCAPAGSERREPATETGILKARAAAWDEAIVRKDRASIEANMSADFRQIDGSGRVETRESFVAGLLDPALEIDPYEVEDFDIRLYGDVALLSGRTRMTGRYAGQPFTSHYRYIDVYVLQGGSWKVASVQITKMTD